MGTSVDSHVVITQENVVFLVPGRESAHDAALGGLVPARLGHVVHRDLIALGDQETAAHSVDGAAGPREVDLVQGAGA